MSKKRKLPSDSDIDRAVDRAVGAPRAGSTVITNIMSTQNVLRETALQRFPKAAILETLRKEIKKTRYLERAIEILKERDGTEMGKAFIDAALEAAHKEIYPKKEEEEGSGEQMDMSQSQDFMPPTHRMMLDEDYKRNYVPIKW